MRFFLFLVAAALTPTFWAFGDSAVSGRVLDPQGREVPGAAVRIESGAGYRRSTTADRSGHYSIESIPNGVYRLSAGAPGLSAAEVNIRLAGQVAIQDLKLAAVEAQHQSIVITAKTVEPEIDMRNSEVFDRTLFTRDDQALEQLNAGINAGQHEGGGKGRPRLPADQEVGPRSGY